MEYVDIKLQLNMKLKKDKEDELNLCLLDCASSW